MARRASRAGSRAGGSPSAPISAMPGSIREIAAAVAAAARQFEALGAVVERGRPDLRLAARGAVHLVGVRRRRIAAQRIPTSARRWSIPGCWRPPRQASASAPPIGSRPTSCAPRSAGAMGAFHQRYDLLLTPTMPVPALPAGQDLNDPAHERHWIDWSPFSYPFNMTRQPAASIPLRADQRRACRSACRSSARFTATTGCCAPPAPSRRPSPSAAHRPSSRARGAR